ncbi:MAG: MmgE/PrpD family protein [Nitrososphaerota archaeon]|jgi:2-methylcitrate dehydratase PrpD|nr:MmgE/PrpD family protein [Nitrososphaerota archaeon]
MAVSMSEGRGKVRTISEYVSQASFEDIPADVVTHAKMLLLDTLGAMLRASSKRYPAGDVMMRLIDELGGERQATIIGRNRKTNVVNAALVNGTFGYYCDVESHHAEAIAHVAAVIVPTALALAEAYNLSGKDLVKSLVVGYDVETRVSNALDPNALYARGFHPSAVAGCFGSAATAGSLLQLGTEKQERAFGLAGCQASGLLAWVTDFTENSRPFQMGVAARNGVTSALLARHGFGAPPDIFEGKNGIFGAFTDAPKPDRLVEDLGRRYTIMEAAFKLYSCCAFIHPGADALLAIISKNGLKHDNIESIELRFPKPGAGIIDNNQLKSHNAQYILPILAVQGEVNIEDILQERRNEAEIARLSKNTKLVYDEELAPLFPAKYTSIVTVRTLDGKSYVERVDHAKGTPENPISYEEVETKFRRLTSPVLSQDQAENIIREVRNITSADSISGLIKLVSTQRS